MNWIETLRILRYVLTVLVAVCYCYQVIYLFLPFFKKVPPHKAERLHKYAIIISARNEEAVLPHLLDSIYTQDYPAELITVYVIADNCTDSTALVAHRMGARVFVRNDKDHVGKGYALAYLLQELQRTGEAAQYDAFLVFDADNLLQHDYLRAINRCCSDGYQVFCGYRNIKNFGDNWITAGYGLMFLHNCVHLNHSRMLIGSSCVVSGTGFGFTRQLLEKTGGWNFLTLTEDLEFSTWCTTHGIRIGYCPDAILFDEQPTSFRQSWRQRTRWVQGGIQVSLRYVKDYRKGLRQGNILALASFELLTLSLWGYVLTVSNGLCALGLTLATGGWQALPKFAAICIALSYLSLLLVGALTLFPQWHRIRATKAQKLRSLLTFPVFIMSYLPIAITAPFRKFHWAPITHSVAVSASSLYTDSQ